MTRATLAGAGPSSCAGARQYGSFWRLAASASRRRTLASISPRSSSPATVMVNRSENGGQLRSCPPFSDLFTITVAGLEERGLIEASVRLRDALAANLQKEPYCRAPAQLLGPAPASVARVNYSYRYQLTLVCKNSAAIRRLLSYVLAEFSRDRRNKGITALIDVNSYQ